MNTFPLTPFKILKKNPCIAVPVIALFIGAFFFFVTSENYIYADDSLPFAVRVQTEPAVKVHHLILSVLYHLNKALGYTSVEDLSRTVVLIKAYVAATSSLALLAVGILAWRWYGSVKVAIWAMLFTAFTYGFWAYSITTDFYIPATAFALVAILFADMSYAAKRPFLLLSFSSLAVLVSSLNHQSYSLITVPIGLGLLLIGLPEPARDIRLRRSVFFVALTATLGFAAFYFSFLTVREAYPSFIMYVQGYAAYMKLMPYDRIQWITPFYSIVGIIRALVFPDYVYHFDTVYTRLHDVFLLKFTFDDMYLIREIPGTVIAVLLGLITILLLVSAWLLVKVVLSYPRNPPRPAGMWMMVGWIACQTIFFSWWEPLSNEMWIWIIPCLVLILTGSSAIRANGISNRVLRWGAIVILIGVNGPVISRYWSSDNDIYTINKMYLQRLRSNDFALTQNFYQPKAIERLIAPRVSTFDFYYDRGGFQFEDSLFQVRLKEVRVNRGCIYIDPMLVMPERSEIAVFKYLGDVDDQKVERGLVELEKYCSNHAIPLYAVERIGNEMIHFQRKGFRGYTEWVDSRLTIIP